jgi:hypothetical protein
MTTPEIISRMGAWKLGGIYTDESPANSYNMLLSMLNEARQSVAYIEYQKGNPIPEVLYQEWEFEASWSSDCSYTAILPKVITLPAPKNNGWDAIVLSNGLPLTQVTSLSRLRQVKSHNVYKNIPTAGYYFQGQLTTEFWIKKGIDFKNISARAILADPTKLEGFNFDLDEYPLNENYLNLIKLLVENEWSRRWRFPTDKISNSINDTENGRAIK